jgi:lysophospholipase L1-like esterase
MLSSTELSSLFHGSYSLEIDGEGYISTKRSTDEQIAYAGSVRTDFGEKLCFGTSVTLELETDASVIEFDYRFDNVKSLRGGIDAWVNGSLKRVFYADETHRGHARLDLPDGSKTVVIYLPCEKRTWIANFFVNGGWKSIPARKSRLLVMGDSITSGVGCEITSYSYINCFNRHYGYEILNQAVGGHAYDEGFLMPLDGYCPDKIIISMGTNQHKASDKGERIENFYRRLSELYPSIPVLVITPIWRLDFNLDTEDLVKTRDIIKNVCAKYSNISVLDGFDILPQDNSFFTDGLHPNSLGASIYGEALCTFAKKIGF